MGFQGFRVSGFQVFEVLGFRAGAQGSLRAPSNPRGSQGFLPPATVLKGLQGSFLVVFKVLSGF